MLLAAEPNAESSRSQLNKLKRCTFVYVTQSRSLSPENIVGRGKEKRRAEKKIQFNKNNKKENIFDIHSTTF